MASLDQILNHHGRPGLWLDYVDYAAALLAKGQAPWLDEGECIAWLRKAQGLLKSDVISLPLGEVCAAWLETHPALRDAMGGKSRSTYALKTLLADDALRSHLVGLARSLRASFAEMPLVLACPSPAAWVAQARRQALGETIVVSDEDADSASMYVADFLRAFGDAGLDALLLEEEAAPRLACYKPVLNVAAHYRWQTGVITAAAVNGGTEGLAFAISPHSTDGLLGGCMLPVAFWSGEAPPACPAPGFLYAQIPADAAPEAVLANLARLRGS